MKITNTSRTPQMFPVPGMIEASEAQGQKELVVSDQLPVKIDLVVRKALEARGVVFGKPTPGDPLFQDVTLPQGWTKKPTDHSMWTDLLDEKGVVVAKIFYKAAFYDRDAFMQLVAPPPPKLFLGMESNNLHLFVSPCCHTQLSLEPLCRIACGLCGKTVRSEDAVYYNPSSS